MTTKKTERQDPPLDVRDKIAGVLIETGYLTEEQVAYARRLLVKLPATKTLLGVLRELRYISEEQLREALHGRPVEGPFGELLVELGYLSRVDLSKALAIQEEDGSKKIGEILIDHHFIDEEKLLEILAHQYGLPAVDLAEEEPAPEVLELASLKELQAQNFLPLRRQGKALLVAFSEMFHPAQVQRAKSVFGVEVTPCITSSKAIQQALRRLELQRQGAAATLQSENVIVEAVNEIIRAAIQEKASDIHLEPLKSAFRVRFRVDGIMIPYKEFLLEMVPAMTSRIKIMAGADITEKRRHQDGRIVFELDDSTLDMRVSFYATVSGEKIVLRLLNKQSLLLDINEIGMFPRMLQLFREEALDAASGVILVTGPTGSGKTTTLYSAVNYLDNINVSITTAEDPVEYVIDGISQCSLNPKISLTYEETLRHIVRQDPDVIVIGEIRDRFSAETAIQAALTGHKVLTTFHTEDSIGGLIRLLDMNIEAFLISSTVVSVLAQRLLRRVCPHCAEEHRLTPHEIRRLGYKVEDMHGVSFMRGKGCRQCRFSGHKGRVPVFELLVLNELVKDALIGRKTSYEIRRISAETAGLVTLLEDGILKAVQGQTSFEEIMRQLPRLSKPRPLSELRRVQGVVG
ncbi:MAG: GspE/PulE family protein [Desulfobulbaceae bacterium]|nr:GspE/PulE family protein [Desulfobulbaceae bacterium]HIJ89513.1 type II/IV secretion system protein [Deltaproteobacteria bacterium]